MGGSRINLASLNSRLDTSSNPNARRASLLLEPALLLLKESDSYILNTTHGIPSQVVSPPLPTKSPTYCVPIVYLEG